MRYLIIGAFVVMVIAQWFVPVSMIMGQEETISNGVEYRFKTRPIDPSDPFRGKYITLQFEAEIFLPSDTNQASFEKNQEVYATLIPDSAGFAQIAYLTAEPPQDLDAYIPATVSYSYVYDGKANVTLDFPFNRFYLEESKASEAEQLVWRNRLDTGTVTYAKVMVGKGKASLTDVMVNDSSIVDVIRRINKNR
ncbi:MAG: GDYXXLXY domain-containing protein [Bacteroidota bacterium]